MSKHTPRPWIVDGHVVHAEDGTLIADLRRKIPSSIFECHIGNMHIAISEVTANARLIGAAPDLLAALELVEWVSSDRWASRRCPWCMGAEDREKHAPDCRRQKAIAKARGADV